MNFASPMTASRPQPLDPRMLRVLTFEDLHVGMRESLMKTVMDLDVVGFARLSGDDNPLHLCDVYAAHTRFGQRIAHGLYTASLISAVLGTRLPGPGAIYRSQTLNFHAPVKIGDVVEVIVEVVELTPKGRTARLRCEALVDGKVVLDGEALVSVPPRSATRSKPSSAA
jgi:3-hydroxybutyryl-CoA dehydratase